VVNGDCKKLKKVKPEPIQVILIKKQFRYLVSTPLLNQQFT